jgi:hypothetical protein
MKKSTVIKIPKGYNFKPIPGFDRYLFDTEKLVVFNKCYNRIWPVGNRSFFQLHIDDGPDSRRTVSLNRLIYATNNKIDYYSIPQNFIFHKEGCKIVVFEKRDQLRWAHSTRIKKAERERIAIIDEKIKELVICRNCYETGNISEAVKYIEEKSPIIQDRFRKRYRVSKEKCYIAYEEAFDIMCEKLKAPSTLVLNLSEQVYRIMTAQHRKHYRNKQMSSLYS